MTFTPFRTRASAHGQESILDLARRIAVPLGNSCGGAGICTSCKVRVLSGAPNLTAPTPIEVKFGSTQKFAEDERMACQARVLGDCEVSTTYW